MEQEGYQKTMLGIFLQENRKKRGWNLYEVEKKTGITASYLHRLEKGIRKHPTVGFAHALAIVYEVHLTTIVDLVLLDQREEERFVHTILKGNENLSK